MVNVRKRKENHSRGAAAAEAALVLPLLLMVTFGAIKYGWLFLEAQQITNAARHGARTVVLPDVSIDDAITSMTELLARANITVNTGEIVITPVDPSVLGKPAFNVHITIPASRVDILPNFPLLPNPENLDASVTMAKEGT
jgi:Flp pilus assembly protein TadG